ncbi:LOW QUALITY PROTEIN: tumor necrosis factor receptor superfamily member 22-like [Phocoena sinus]|uniref:LOW QUALITY PROTEIN: tumor necrosis factor receptor superfamily member 22-like n=1 Tax=Phocoena sinus TaxID=42100 RepID=UPI0013C52E41|nr:LOW QUALITY PROTEIN: tumor necrosis factor receptor superfamily member 22-like [Phocoena sinus]
MEPRARGVLAVLLLLAAQVTMATGETRCNPGEYEVTSLSRCSKLCPAGYYVSKYIDQDHSVGECRECESGTFRAHPSEESSCVPCSQCREDQEVVTECFSTSDRLCQCKQGNFYCDSMDCTESCFRCKRCEDSTILQPCNATRDTVCAVKIHPEAGNLMWAWILLAVTVVLSIATAIITAITHHYRRRAACFFQSVVGFGKQNPKEPGSPSPRSSQPKEVQMPMDLERGQPAPGVETRPMLEVEDSALAPEARTHPGPSKDAGEILELQELGAKGSPAAPEQTIQQTQAPETPRPPGQAEVSPSLHSLEQLTGRQSDPAHL